MNIRWYCKTFNDLLPHELYKILQLRSEVFVVEQNCVFLEMDDKDEGCMHYMCFENDALIAYTRLAPAGYIYKEASIGRVVTSPLHRGKGLGKELMQRSIKLCKQYFGDDAIKIGAQYHLMKFYEGFGFKVVGEKYMEDGIEHVHMRLDADSNNFYEIGN